MKTLASCKPSEFLVQTNKIRKSVERWLKDTKILDIRKNIPKPTKVTDDMSEEEKEKIIKKNREARNKAARENLSKILDAILEKYPEETLEVLALVCFIEPKDADNYKVTDYLRAIAEILNDKDVIDFFGSLIQWGQSDILN
jgi:hypothetical protein